MKRNWLIWILLCDSLHGAAQDTAARLFPPGEAICGYAGRYVALEAGQAKRGLSVELLVGDAAVAQPVPLRFRVCQKPGEMPVDDLQVEHETLMHVIAIREDLGDFLHLHPRRTAPGLWEIVQVFTNAGRYQVWSDIKHRGTVYSFAHPRLTVAGESRAVAQGPVPQFEDTKSGYHLTLTPAQLPLVAGQTNSIEIVVRNRFGNPVGTDFFLGALMHLIIVKEDLSVYLHAHAEDHVKSSRPISFKQVFPQPGRYKIFAQFRPQKTELPPDEALLAEFWVVVEAG